MDWCNIDQFSRQMESQVFYPYYQEIDRLADRQSMAISLASPLLGLMDGLACTVQAIGGVAEAIIKGLENLFRGEGKRGALQLLGSLAIAVLSIPRIPYQIAKATLALAIAPKEAAAYQVEFYRAKAGSPKHVVLEVCEAQAGEIQGAAAGGYPKQSTPQRVGDAGRRSRSPASASRLQHYMFRTTRKPSRSQLLSPAKY